MILASCAQPNPATIEPTKPPENAPQPTTPPVAAPTEAPTEASAPAPTQAPASTEKTLNITFVQEPDSLNPLYTQMWFSWRADELFEVGLWHIDDKLNANLEMAAELPTLDNGGISEDGKLLTVKLRKDAAWSDGEPVTANDFVFTYQMYIDPKNTVRTRYPYDTYVASVTAPDDYTVVISMTQPYVAWMTGFFRDVLPKHILEPVYQKDGTLDNADWNRNPTVGNGPFVFKEWVAASHMIFEANPKYWRGKPNIDRIYIRIVPDKETQLASIKSGETDMGTYITADASPTIDKLKDYKLVTVSSGWMEVWFFKRKFVLCPGQDRLSSGRQTAAGWQLPCKELAPITTPCWSRRMAAYLFSLKKMENRSALEKAAGRPMGSSWLLPPTCSAGRILPCSIRITGKSSGLHKAKAIKSHRLGRRLAIRSASSKGHGPTSSIASIDLNTRHLCEYSPGPGVISHPSFSIDQGQLYFLFESPASPPDLWRLDLAASAFQPITRSLPGSIDTGAFVTPQAIEYPGMDGQKVPAILYKPSSKTRALPPAVIFIHGGPDWLAQIHWDPLLQSMAKRGWVVLAPNYRSSTGYGRDWQHANRFDLGGADAQDILAGRDFLLSSGLAEPGRVAVTGRSYGGYLTMVCLAQYPGRWKAGSAVVPFLNWLTSHANSREDLQGWDLENLGDPVKDRDRYVQRSPFFFLDRVDAPVQLICGALDPRCPASESNQAYQALADLGKECDLVIYPDEGHVFLKIENVIDHKIRCFDFLSKALEGNENT